MRKAHTASLPSNKTIGSKENIIKEGTTGASKIIDESRKVADSRSISKRKISSQADKKDNFGNCKNPMNGRDCFFSESVFNLVMGPELSFKEKLLSQMAYIKSEEKAKLIKPEQKKSERNDRPSKAELLRDAQVIEQNTLEQDFNDSAEVTRVGSPKNKSAKNINCKFISDTSTTTIPVSLDEHTHVNYRNLKHSEQKSCASRDDIFKDEEVNKLSSSVSLSSHGTIDHDLHGSAVSTNVINKCSNSTPAETINCELFSDITAIHNLANTNELKPETLEQNTLDTRKDLIGNAHISISVVPLHIDIPNQDFNDGTKIVSMTNICPTEKSPKNVKCELASCTTTLSTLVSSDPKEHNPSLQRNISEYLNNSELKYEDETSLLVALDKVSEEHLEGSSADGCTAHAENTTRNLISALQDTNDVCLVMPSLSSDDDDDDDDNDLNYNEIPDISSKHAPGLCAVDKNNLVIAASVGDQSLQTTPTSLTAGNVTISVPDLPNSLQSSQAASLDSCDLNSSLLQPASAPTWSDVDIPIFSIKEASPPPVVKSVSINQESKNTFELAVKAEDKQTSQNVSETSSTNQSQTFRKSDLTRAEHELYLKLYNKYVRSLLRRGPPPVLTETLRGEISKFEKLQRRVLREQDEFQNYLLENARKKKSYNYLKAEAKKYATRKAQSYRLNMNYEKQFSQTLQSQIPIYQETEPVELRFQQTVLEVGLPPRIKLPDIPPGHKPVPLQYDMKQINSSFPRQSRSVPGYIHHEAVSCDANVKKLAEKYDFQVVMSSSVVKCLLNNSGPSFDRTWNIPVYVLELESNGKRKKVVHLDKPLFENDLCMRDYSTLFHKVALRTFVSHPKNTIVQDVQKLFHQAVRAEIPAVLDDPFDIFSPDIDSLETFGVGSSKLLNLDSKSTEVVNEKSEGKLNCSLENSNTVTHAAEGSACYKPVSPKCANRMLRSGMKSHEHCEEMNDAVNHISKTSLSDSTEKQASNPDTPIKRKRGRPRKSDAPIVNQKLPLADSELEGEPKKKKSRSDNSEILQQLNKCLPVSSMSESQDSEKMDRDQLDSSVTNNDCLSLNTYSPQSPEKYCAPHTSSSTNIHSPLSPIASPPPPASPSPEHTKNSSFRHIIREIPLSPDRTSLSPVKEIPLSPIRKIPLSPVKKIPLSRVHDGQLHVSLPYEKSPDKKRNKSTILNSSTFQSLSARDTNQTLSGSAGIQCKQFTPLDSILGPSFGLPERKVTHDASKEDPSSYLPSTEAHSSIMYSLWSLGCIDVLIRTRCHGVLRDLKKKRRIYFSPKMEYQTVHGLEQVTVTEVAKEWTSCFIRPDTNLLRARINAYTSEIIMFEELEPSQILRSSLNFKPENGFQFLKRVLQQMLSLKCGRYLLTHESGNNFCGIRSAAGFEEKVVPKKRMSKEYEFSWIPIDPTIFLPYHIANNRIPATFLPKDVQVNNFHSGGKKSNFNQNNGRNYTNDVSASGKKRKKRKKWSKKFNLNNE